MPDLSDRQRQLLKVVIELYVKEGEPIGSETVEKSHNLGISPATIRHEMVCLTDLGFLKQPHTSAGRIPTALGFRLYVNELMKEKDLSVVDEVRIKQQLMDYRARQDRLVKEALKTLAAKCSALAVAVDDEGDVYYSGAANILDLSEFYDIDVTRFVLSMLDEHSILKKIIEKAVGEDPLHIIFGEETEFEYLQPTSFAFTHYEMGPQSSGTIGVVGPARLNFPLVFPYLRYVSRLLSEVGGG